jgi:hypothetical protein
VPESSLALGGRLGTTFLNALSERFGGLLSKDLLFGSVLPLVLVGVGWLALLAWMFGLAASLELVAKAEASSLGLIATLTMPALLAAGYALLAMRATLLSLWSGYALELGLKPLWDWRRKHYQSRLDDLVERSESEEAMRREISSDWATLLHDIQSMGRLSKARMDDDEIDTMMRQLTKISESEALTSSWLKEGEAILSEIKNLQSNEQAIPPGEVDRIAERVRVFHSKLEIWAREQSPMHRDALRDRYIYFGARDAVAPTRLGNLVNATSYYAYSRYRMEGSVLMPRLLAVLPARTLEQLGDQRLLLDFWLALASLALGSTLAILFGLPWLWPNPLPILTAVVIAGGTMRLSYWIAIGAMLDLAELTRAACDLGRLRLMRELGLPDPTSHAEERDAWERMFRLIVYGQPGEIRYRSPLTN